MRRIILLLLVQSALWMNLLSANISSIKIDGIVLTDASTPIKGAIISVGQDTLAVSDANGAFAFNTQKSLEIVLTIAKDGYSMETMCLKDPSDDVHLQVIMYRCFELGEVVLKAKRIKETVSKTLLFPSKKESKHSFNVFQLIDNMNLPDLSADILGKQLQTTSGRETVILVNGMEASADEVATLSVKNVKHIEYQHFPSGKYVGKGAVVNILLKQSDMGGNVYLTNEHGFSSPYGNYLGMVDCKNKGWTFAALVSGNWKKDAQYQDAQNSYRLEDGELNESVHTLESTEESNAEYARLKISHIKDATGLNVSVGFTRQATPEMNNVNQAVYNGLFNGKTSRTSKSVEEVWSPSINTEYVTWINDNDYLNLTASVSYGRNRYTALVRETNYDDIYTQVKEDSYTAAFSGLWSRYFKSSSIGVSADVNHQHYDDDYTGAMISKQSLHTTYSRLLLQWQQTINSKCNYYISGGLSWTAAHTNGRTYDYVNPVAFYGARYTISDKQSFSLSGFLTSTTFSPEYKNNNVLPVSFFQTVVGNPDLANLKAFQNMIAWNGHWGNLNLACTYDFMVYLDNITNKYYTEGSTLFRTLVNDGNFWSNRFILSTSCNLFNQSLRLNGKAIAEIYDLDGKAHRASHRGVRGSLGATYLTGVWKFRGAWKFPYKTFGMREPSFYKEKNRLDISAAWNNDTWQVEAGARNLLNEYKHSHEYFNHNGVWGKQKDIFNRSCGSNVYLSLTYRISYGKKKKATDKSYNSSINSAILKPF